MSEALQNDSLKMMDAVIKRFENPDEIREFEKPCHRQRQSKRE